MGHALEVVRYVLEAQFNLISKGCSMKKDARFKSNKASSQSAKEIG